MMRSFCSITSLAIAACSTATAMAHSQFDEPAVAESAAADSASSGGKTSQSDLKLSFIPYAWLTSFNGTSGARGVEAEVDTSFVDILDESDSIFALMGALDLTADRLVLQLNGAYSTAEFGESRGRARSGPLGGSATVDATLDIEIESAWFEAFGGYRIVDASLNQETGSSVHLDLFAGIRHTVLDLDIDATADSTITLPGGQVLTGGRSRSLDQQAEWFEPFVGMRTGIALNEHWRLSLRGDIGGFGLDNADFAWQVVAAIGYEWGSGNWRYGLFGGYRALGQEYAEDGFIWDIVTHGPIVGFGATYRF